MHLQRSVFIGASTLLLSLAACKGPTMSLEKTRPLPETADASQKASSEPSNPYAEASPGLFSRAVFQADGPPGYRIEVRDLMIAPKKKAEDIKLPGAAFLEVRYGAGVLTQIGQRKELTIGTTFSVSQGQSFTLEATSDQALNIRAQIVAAQ